MNINVHAGHNPDGKVACGTVGIILESTEARKVKDEVISQLQRLGHTVYDTTCENGTGQADVLSRIVSKCNSHIVDLDVSIHFNAGAVDSTGNGKTTGTEVLIYKSGYAAQKYAQAVVDSISELGYKNRGVKIRPDLYFLRKTSAPAILIECCFVDDKDDVQLYDYRKMAEAIVYGITGQKVQPENIPATPDKEAELFGAETTIGDEKSIYRVQIGAYSIKDNADRMQKKLKEAGFDAIIVKA